MNRSGIYRFVVHRPNLPPKFYIGQAAILRKRRNKHFSELRRGVHSNENFQRAFALYGEDAFSFEIVVICDKSKGVLDLYERSILSLYSDDQLYNMCRECVGSRIGVHHSEETKKKIGIANQGHSRSSAHRAAVSLSNRTRKVSQETREKMSKALRGNKRALGHVQTEEHKLKVAVFFRGRKKSMEEIARRNATRKANRIAHGHD